ncbi:MAG: hypothetical protein PHV09_07560 [Bacteroidales bacterium]|nr:hypothetical protein [Bacteroidales bacterium]
MRNFLLFAFIFFTSNSVFSQENKIPETKFTYAVITGTQSNLSDEFKVELNFGADFISKDKKESKFKSLVDALNFVSAYSWSLDRTYVNTYEKMNKSIHYWVIKRPVSTNLDSEKRDLLNKFYDNK